MRTRATLAMAGVVLALSGCDPTWLLNIEIAVPAGAQMEAGEYPQAVFVTMSDATGEGAVYPSLAAVICEPGADPFRFRTMQNGIGRTRGEDTMVAWVERLPPGLEGEPCGPRKYVRGEAARAIPANAWRASDVVFECNCGEDSVSLVLAPP